MCQLKGGWELHTKHIMSCAGEAKLNSSANREMLLQPGSVPRLRVSQAPRGAALSLQHVPSTYVPREAQPSRRNRHVCGSCGRFSPAVPVVAWGAWGCCGSAPAHAGTLGTWQTPLPSAAALRVGS